MALQTTPSQLCEAATFASLSLDNIKINSLEAVAYSGLSVPAFTTPRTTNDEIETVDICSLTVDYIHPGDNDTVTTWVGLPLTSESWNGRFLMNGGGGWLTGRENGTITAVASGYTSASTNGGHDGGDWPTWGLWSNGSVNWPALEDFSSRALVEAMYLGKQATELYHGSKPSFSYWNGCSTGGRQGHVMAQLVPGEFDGILAGAPAINWAKFLVMEAWGYVKALEYGISPPPCVFDAFTAAAVNACDALDGVEDGLISLPGSCTYDPSALVGKEVECSDFSTMVLINEDMANLVHDIWTGPETADGQFLWYGLTKDAQLEAGSNAALVASTCTSAEDCSLSVFDISRGWIETFTQQQTRSDTFNITREEFYTAFSNSVAAYTNTISFANPDLTELKANGTKVLVWHGLADPLIPVNGSVDYYERVTGTMGNVDDFYRLFLAPGVGHCGMKGGLGLDPTSELVSELVSWVENGTAPATIAGTGPAVGPGNITATRTIRLCPYPKVLSFTGTDPNDATHFECL